MKKTLIALLGAFVLTTTPALAGEKHGDYDKGCSAPAQECLDHLAKTLENRGWVGVHLEPLENGRLKLITIVEDSPAEAAGLQVGDVLVAAEGLKYGKASDEEWSELMKTWAPGRMITYKIMRDGVVQKTRLKLGELPPQIRFQMVGHHMMEHVQVAQAVN